MAFEQGDELERTVGRNGSLVFFDKIIKRKITYSGKKQRTN
jgi:hypothetical protein